MAIHVQTSAGNVTINYSMELAHRSVVESTSATMIAKTFVARIAHLVRRSVKSTVLIPSAHKNAENHVTNAKKNVIMGANIRNALDCVSKSVIGILVISPATKSLNVAIPAFHSVVSLAQRYAGIRNVKAMNPAPLKYSLATKQTRMPNLSSLRTVVIV